MERVAVLRHLRCAEARIDEIASKRRQLVFWVAALAGRGPGERKAVCAAVGARPPRAHARVVRNYVLMFAKKGIAGTPVAFRAAQFSASKGLKTGH